MPLLGTIPAVAKALASREEVRTSLSWEPPGRAKDAPVRLAALRLGGLSSPLVPLDAPNLPGACASRCMIRLP